MNVSALSAVLVLAAGCTGDLVDLTARGTDGSAPQQQPQQDAGDATGGGDAATTNGNGDAGTTSSSVTFSGQVYMDLQLKGCTASACHGGTQVPVLKGTSVDDDYTSILTNPQDAKNGANSLILTKNLPASAGGVSHGGGTAFPSGTSDPTYQRWLAWINAGNPK